LFAFSLFVSSQLSCSFLAARIGRRRGATLVTFAKGARPPESSLETWCPRASIEICERSCFSLAVLEIILFSNRNDGLAALLGIVVGDVIML
jgi:hypothetical protein